MDTDPRIVTAGIPMGRQGTYERHRRRARCSWRPTSPSTSPARRCTPTAARGRRRAGGTGPSSAGSTTRRSPAWTPTDDAARRRRGQGLADLIGAEAARSEADATLSPVVVEAFHETGLFGLMVPKELGGEEADLPTVLAVYEEVCRADGSAGWTPARQRDDLGVRRRVHRTRRGGGDVRRRTHPGGRGPVLAARHRGARRRRCRRLRGVGALQLRQRQRALAVDRRRRVRAARRRVRGRGRRASR